MSATATYKKLQEKYRETAAAAREGNAQAKKDKAKIVQDIRQIERQSARDGKVLAAVVKGDQVTVDVTQTETKRSLQEEYCRKFDDEKIVKLDGREQTLRQYHRRRLLGRS